MESFRCIVCGEPREEAKRDCGKHTYEEYQKVKSKVRNDPWPYFPISFGGWALMSSAILVLIHVNDMTPSQLESLIPFIQIPSLIVPITLAILFHRYRQNKKGLPFLGLTDEQEVEWCLKK